MPLITNPNLCCKTRRSNLPFGGRQEGAFPVKFCEFLRFMVNNTLLKLSRSSYFVKTFVPLRPEKNDL